MKKKTRQKKLFTFTRERKKQIILLLPSIVTITDRDSTIDSPASLSKCNSYRSNEKKPPSKETIQHNTFKRDIVYEKNLYATPIKQLGETTKSILCTIPKPPRPDNIINQQKNESRDPNQ